LTGGTYVFRLNDSLGIQNNELFINVEISDCFVATINDTSGTTCGDSNGTFTINTTSTAAPYNIVLYKNNAIFSTFLTNTLPYNITSLGEGIYYATVFDYGMVSAITDNVVINASSGTTFGIWKVNTSDCVPNSGKLAVTGLTGNGPYSFLWSNGETTQITTGLTVGTYTVTVTDFYGCETVASETVGVANPLGVGLITSINPSCFDSNGSITVQLTGGTAPYTISANTGYQTYTLSDTFTVPNLPSGFYNILVKDANLCSLLVNASLTTVNGFDIISTNITNTTCNGNDGEVNIVLTGIPPFLFQLTAITNNSISTQFSSNLNTTFSNLN
jgi:hypothetical protein